jgi:hypothetical protein
VKNIARLFVVMLSFLAVSQLSPESQLLQNLNDMPFGGCPTGCHLTE